jgi:hypothetical protein
MGVVVVAVTVRGESTGKSWLLGVRENGGLDECLDERFVGDRGFWRVDGHTQQLPSIVTQRDPTGYVYTHKKNLSLLSPFCIFRQTFSNLEIINESYSQIQCYKKKLKHFSSIRPLKTIGLSYDKIESHHDVPNNTIYWNKNGVFASNNNLFYARHKTATFQL